MWSVQARIQPGKTTYACTQLALSREATPSCTSYEYCCLRCSDGCCDTAWLLWSGDSCLSCSKDVFNHLYLVAQVSVQRNLQLLRILLTFEIASRMFAYVDLLCLHIPAMTCYAAMQLNRRVALHVHSISSQNTSPLSL